MALCTNINEYKWWGFGTLKLKFRIPWMWSPNIYTYIYKCWLGVSCHYVFRDWRYSIKLRFMCVIENYPFFFILWEYIPRAKSIISVFIGSLSSKCVFINLLRDDQFIQIAKTDHFTIGKWFVPWTFRTVDINCLKIYIYQTYV